MRLYQLLQLRSGPDVARPGKGIEGSRIHSRSRNQVGLDYLRNLPIQRTGSLVISDANVRLQLAEEDAAAIEKGDKELVHENVSPSMLIYQGLEFEDFQ